MKAEVSLLIFDRSCVDSWDSAAIADFDKDTDLSGAKWLCRENKGDGDMRKIGIGLELKRW